MADWLHPAWNPTGSVNVTEGIYRTPVGYNPPQNTNTLLYGATPMPSAGGVSTSNSVMPMARPTVGTVASGLAYGGGGGRSGGGGGGGGFSMGQHFNEKFNHETGRWEPVTIDATPGDPPSPMAPGGYGMGQVQALPDPLADVGGTNPNSRSVPQLAYGGGGVHTAIVGDPQADGGPNPEMVTSASPIHVRPLRGGKMPNVPKFAYGNELPSDLSRPTGSGSGDLELHPDSRYAVPNAVNYSTGAGQAYTDPSENLRAVIDSEHDAGRLTPMQREKSINMLDQGSSADDVRPLLSQAWQHNLAESRQVTPYANEQSARTAIENAGNEEVGESAPDNEQAEGETAIQQPVGNQVPQSEPESSTSAPVIQSPQGTAFSAAERVRQAFNPNAPANPNLPQAPVALQAPAMPSVDPFGEMKAAENPMRRQRAIRDYVKRNPMALPQMEMNQRAATQKAQAAADKFNAENVQKHAETLRKIAHNAAQEMHWDDTIQGRTVVESAKLQEQAKKDFEKKRKETEEVSDALGNIQTRAGMVQKGDPSYAEKVALLNHIMGQKTAKAISDGIKYYDTIYPHEMVIGGQKAVGTPSGPRFVPQPPANHGKMTPSQLWLQQNLGK